MFIHFRAKFETDIWIETGWHGEIDMPITVKQIHQNKDKIIKIVKRELAKKIKQWKQDPNLMNMFHVFYHEKDKEVNIFEWKKSNVSESDYQKFVNP